MTRQFIFVNYRRQRTGGPAAKFSLLLIAEKDGMISAITACADIIMNVAKLS